jgi:hypothetical protein
MIRMKLETMSSPNSHKSRGRSAERYRLPQEAGRWLSMNMLGSGGFCISERVVGYADLYMEFGARFGGTGFMAQLCFLLTNGPNARFLKTCYDAPTSYLLGHHVQRKHHAAGPGQCWAGHSPSSKEKQLRTSGSALCRLRVLSPACLSC